jgi:hypothetical protein
MLSMFKPKPAPVESADEDSIGESAQADSPAVAEGAPKKGDQK